MGYTQSIMQVQGVPKKTRILLGKEAEMAVFLTCIWEIPGSMLAASPCTLPQYSRGKYRYSIRIAYLRLLMMNVVLPFDAKQYEMYETSSNKQ